jgi:hypothetical protein
MARGKPTISAVFDPDPIHIVLTEIEFDRICETAKIPEKENVFLLVGLFVPCAINAYLTFPIKGGQVSTEFILNSIVAAATLLVGGFQSRAWYAKRSQFSLYVKQLRERPMGRMSFAQPQGSAYVSNIPAETES